MDLHSYHVCTNPDVCCVDLQYCDFVLCTFLLEQCKMDLHIERILHDDDKLAFCMNKSNELDVCF